MNRFAGSKEVDIVQDVMAVLDRWYIAASGDGSLWVQPRHRDIRLPEFCSLLKRIHRVFDDRRFNALVFHFDGVEVPRSLWLIMLRLLTAFARLMQTECRVIQSVKVKKDLPAPGDLSTSDGPAPTRTNSSPPITRLDGISIVIESKPAGAPQADAQGRPGR